jgi:hypothetical protein
VLILYDDPFPRSVSPSSFTTLDLAVKRTIFPSVIPPAAGTDSLCADERCARARHSRIASQSEELQDQKRRPIGETRYNVQVKRLQLLFAFPEQSILSLYLFSKDKQHRRVRKRVRVSFFFIGNHRHPIDEATIASTAAADGRCQRPCAVIHALFCSSKETVIKSHDHRDDFSPWQQ